MIRKIIEIKAWKEFVDLNMQSYLFTILFCLANDYCDMPFDIRAGKKRAIHEIPKSVTLGILATFILVSFFLIVLLLLKGSGYAVFIPVYAAAWLLSICYSAFPMRLKERGVWGIIDDVLIEKTFPVFLIFSFFNCYSLETLIIVLFFSFLQLKIILDHQCWDYNSDVKSGVKTFAVKRGIEKVTPILNITRKLFLAFFLLSIALVIIRCAYSLIVIILLFFGYFIMQRLVSQGKLERKNIRTDLNIYSFLFLLVIVSQYYIIKGHYMQILKNIFKAKG
jgi:4-hydroxybenzoate polyprenyltransferase